jgi:carboxypeptidase PM20D1
MIKRLLLGLLAVVVLLVGAVAVNTARQGSRQLQVPPVQGVAVDERAVAESLAVAIRARTIPSFTEPGFSAEQFRALHAHLESRYPQLHGALKREVVNDFSLLYTWAGSDAALPGVALMAHQDVVPVASGTEGDWQADPFGGQIKDGFVWGRGAWDDKGNLIAQLEAVEKLVAAGFKPNRTLYLVFGADEEVGGGRGAQQIAALLKQRGVKLDFVIDEGLLITQGLLPGIAGPAALVGVAEKGYLSLQLQAKAAPGHSSMPAAQPGRSAIAQLSHALVKLDTRPMPAAIGGVAGEMFDTMAPEMSGFGRVALSNRWLLGTLVQRQLEQSPSTNALLRTTTALTMLNAGNKDNVLPGRAEGVVNFRLLPGETRESLIADVKKLIDNDEVELRPLPGGSDPSTVARTDSRGYQLINRTVRELFPGTIVMPGLYLAGSDSRHFQDLSANVFKFSPLRARPEDLSRFHGTNERISLANLVELVRFYHRLIEQSVGPAPAAQQTASR